MSDPAFFELLAPADREALEARGRRRRFPAGQVLFSEGDDGHEVFVVLDGLVKIVNTSPTGRDVILEVFDEHNLLGELSAVDGMPRSATAIALTPVEVLSVGTRDFAEFLDTRGAAARALLQMLVARLRRSSQRQLEFGTSDALGRLSSCLLTMLDRYGASDASGKVTMPLAQHEIAAMTGLSREAVVKGLRALRSLGWIDLQARDLTIRDEAALRARAAG